MTALATIAGIKARRIRASDLTATERIELAEAATRRVRLRAALRLSVLEAERDKAAAEAERLDAECADVHLTLADMQRAEADRTPITGAAWRALTKRCDAAEREVEKARALTYAVARSVGWETTDEIGLADAVAALRVECDAYTAAHDTATEELAEAQAEARSRTQRAQIAEDAAVALGAEVARLVAEGETLRREIATLRAQIEGLRKGVRNEGDLPPRSETDGCDPPRYAVTPETPMTARPLAWLIGAFVLSESAEAAAEIDRRFP